MTNLELHLICTMLNALAVVHGYSQKSIARYASHITEGRISCIGVWQLRDKLKDDSHPESLAYKRAEELEELGIYEWYIPTETLVNDYTSVEKVLYYDLANYVLTDHWKIDNEYQIASSLDAITCAC